MSGLPCNERMDCTQCPKAVENSIHYTHNKKGFHLPPHKCETNILFFLLKGQIWIICNKFQEKDRRILFPLVCLLPLRKTIACGREHRGLNLCGQTQRSYNCWESSRKKVSLCVSMGRYTG